MSGTKAVFAGEMVAERGPDPAPGAGGSSPRCPGCLRVQWEPAENRGCGRALGFRSPGVGWNSAGPTLGGVGRLLELPLSGCQPWGAQGTSV